MDFEKETGDLFKTMNTRIQLSCNELLSEIDNNHGKLKSSWATLLVAGEETKKTRRKSEIRKSESQIGNSTKALSLLSDYVDSLGKLKLKHTQIFIESIRNEIEILWDNCSYGEEQRKGFDAFYSEAYNEDILREHEDHLRVLKLYYNNNKELFKLVLKREKLWHEKVAFENPADGCSRFENRGGTLIKELKRIQVVEKLLPSTEKQIRLKVKAWEKANKKHFLVKDQQYVKYIDQQKIEYKAEQEMKRQAKRLAKQEELILEISHDSIATKRASVYDNSHSKCGTSKKFNEESLKELMKPTESSISKTRLSAKNPGTLGDRLSKSTLPETTLMEELPSSHVKNPTKRSGTTHDELSSTLSKVDLSSQNCSSIPRKVFNTSQLIKVKAKGMTEENLREIAKPTESSLLKSRLRVPKNENTFKRRGTLMTDAKKKKLKRRSVIVSRKNCLKETNIQNESSSSEKNNM